ncbi:MAG TPA: ATP12 family protein [Rhizomicrobium sp.]
MKRFYKKSSVGESGGAFQVMLDGRSLKTPSGTQLNLPTRALAGAVAEEWNAAGEKVDLHGMLLTRLAFAAVDSVARNRAHVEEQVAGFGRSDLLSYRAEGPAALVARENAAWNPLLDWAAEQYGARLAVVSGITHTEQSAKAMAALEKAVRAQDDFALAALHAAVTITGSLVLALALREGRIDAGEAFAAATVNESFQAEKWGRDEEADARFANHAAELSAAERFMRLL